MRCPTCKAERDELAREVTEERAAHDHFAQALAVALEDVERLIKEGHRLRAGEECHVARPGEGTLECRVDRKCLACRARDAEAELKRWQDATFSDTPEALSEHVADLCIQNAELTAEAERLKAELDGKREWDCPLCEAEKLKAELAKAATAIALESAVVRYENAKDSVCPEDPGLAELEAAGEQLDEAVKASRAARDGA